MVPLCIVLNLWCVHVILITHPIHRYCTRPHIRMLSIAHTCSHVHTHVLLGEVLVVVVVFNNCLLSEVRIPLRQLVNLVSKFVQSVLFTQVSSILITVYQIRLNSSSF